jgi:plasmid stability protein
MTNLLVRDVDDALVRKLRQRAHANGRSVAEELRLIIRDALLGGTRQDIHELAAVLRKLTRGRKHTPAEVLVREGRDER